MLFSTIREYVHLKALTVDISSLYYRSLAHEAIIVTAKFTVLFIYKHTQTHKHPL